MKKDSYFQCLSAFQRAAPRTTYWYNNQSEHRAQDIACYIEQDPEIRSLLVDAVTPEDFVCNVFRIAVGDKSRENWRIMWRLNESDNYGIALEHAYDVVGKNNMERIKIFLKEIFTVLLNRCHQSEVLRPVPHRFYELWTSEVWSTLTISFIDTIWNTFLGYIPDLQVTIVAL